MSVRNSRTSNPRSSPANSRVPLQGATRRMSPTPQRFHASNRSSSVPVTAPSAASANGTRVQVCVRLRPFTAADGGNFDCAVSASPSVPGQVQWRSPAEQRDKQFNFDHVFTKGQDEVFDVVGRPALEEVFNGYNACVFAYGQTGSGKTHTIMGDSPGLNGALSGQRIVERQLTEAREAPPPEGGSGDGLLPRLLDEMLSLAADRMEKDCELTVRIEMSILEVYQERVRDLLHPAAVSGSDGPALSLVEDPITHSVTVAGARKVVVLSATRALRLIQRANEARHVADTKMNERSSRSHCLVQFHFFQVREECSSLPNSTSTGHCKADGCEAKHQEDTALSATLTIVDLAGSERLSKTESSGIQLEEAKLINRSLLMLGRALCAFSGTTAGGGPRSPVHVPLRDSKLTRILSDCFGGNAKAWMLATVSPSAAHVGESLSTLSYATHAKSVVNRPTVNHVQTAHSAEIVSLQHALGAHTRDASRAADILNSLIKYCRTSCVQLGITCCDAKGEKLDDADVESLDMDGKAERLQSLLAKLVEAQASAMSSVLCRAHAAEHASENNSVAADEFKQKTCTLQAELDSLFIANKEAFQRSAVAEAAAVHSSQENEKLQSRLSSILDEKQRLQEKHLLLEQEYQNLQKLCEATTIEKYSAVDECALLTSRVAELEQQHEITCAQMTSKLADLQQQRSMDKTRIKLAMQVLGAADARLPSLDIAIAESRIISKPAIAEVNSSRVATTLTAMKASASAQIDVHRPSVVCEAPASLEERQSSSVVEPQSGADDASPASDSAPSKQPSSRGVSDVMDDPYGDDAGDPHHLGTHSSNGADFGTNFVQRSDDEAAGTFSPQNGLFCSDYSEDDRRGTCYYQHENVADTVLGPSPSTGVSEQRYAETFAQSQLPSAEISPRRPLEYTAPLLRSQSPWGAAASTSSRPLDSTDAGPGWPASMPMDRSSCSMQIQTMRPSQTLDQQRHTYQQYPTMRPSQTLDQQRHSLQQHHQGYNPRDLGGYPSHVYY